MKKSFGTICVLLMLMQLVVLPACSNGEAATSVENENTQQTIIKDDSKILKQSTSQTGSAIQSSGSSFNPKTDNNLSYNRVPLSADISQNINPKANNDLNYNRVPLSASNLQNINPNSGIWVTGKGSISLDPDLVMLNITVETTAKTVSKARNQAAEAMDDIVKTLQRYSLEDKDIQTQSFSIWPKYEYPEVTIRGTKTRRQTLVGYIVNNTARIKIRDLELVGKIIDDVSTAGGDVTRINDIDFTMENPDSFMNKLREQAVKDAISKAEQFAVLTGVSVGSLVYISEMGSGAPVTKHFSESGAFAARSAMEVSSTSIAGGELELSLSIQAVFSIN